MTTYRLPEAWGGLEVEESFGSYDSVPDGYLMVLLPRSQWAALFPKDALTEVKPPIPAEPEPGAYLIGDALWFRPADARGARWVGPDGICWEWEQAWRRSLTRPDVTITPLVPSVPVEPVQLPWEFADEDGDKVRVDRARDVWTIDRAGGRTIVVLSPEARRSMIAALSAADRSETP